MNKVMLSLAMIALIGFTACTNTGNNSEETVVKTDATGDAVLASASFGVRGNCKMCKATIEKAANGVDGVTEAVWDIDLKKIAVSYDGSKTDEAAIHQAIAASGYDTDQVIADQRAYESNAACCRYDRDMKMSLETPADNDGSH